MVLIIDYGVGNISSIVNMLDFVGVDATVSCESSFIRAADKIILPGVSSFDKAMLALEKVNVIDDLEDAVLENSVPILGICLGMQLLGNSSEEGGKRGLGWIDAECIKINPGEGSYLKVPNNGWHEVELVNKNRLFDDENTMSRFYFNHSYHMVCKDESNVNTVISYGSDLTASVSKKNIYGVQFHPEKSHRYGMQLLKNFSDL